MVKSMLCDLKSWISRLREKRFPAGSLQHRFAAGAIWSLAGTLVARGLNLITSIVIARSLGKVGYGEFGIIQSTVLIFGTFAGLGLGMTATKYLAEYHRSDPGKAGSILSLSLFVAVLSGALIALVFAIYSPELADGSLAAPQLTPLLRLGSVLLFLEAFNGAQTGALAGFESFRAIASVNFVAALVSFPVTIVGVWLAGLQGSVWGLVAFSATSCFLNYRALRSACTSGGINISYAGCLKEWPVLWHFTLPSFIANALVGPVTWLCYSMLVKQPTGYAEMGILNAANQWRSFLLLLPGIFSSIALPMLSSTSGTDEENSFARIINLNQRASIVVVVPLGIFLMFVGDLILGWYGRDFRDGYPVIVGTLAGITISSIGSAAGSAIQARGKMWLGALMNFTWGAVYLLYVYCTVSALGARSLAYGFALAHLVLLLWGYVYLYRDLPPGMFMRTLMAVALVTALAVCAITFHAPLRYYMLVPALMLAGTFIVKQVIRSGRERPELIG